MFDDIAACVGVVVVVVAVLAAAIRLLLLLRRGVDLGQSRGGKSSNKYKILGYL